MTQAARFRELLRRDGMVVAPGAYDCITARLIERAGFDSVYMTGAGTAATLGYPDFGLVTMSEMVANAGRIAAAIANGSGSRSRICSRIVEETQMPPGSARFSRRAAIFTASP